MVDDLSMRAWRGFLEAHARVTAVLEEELRREANLPLAWYDVLVQLHEAGGRLRMQELARAVLLSKSGLSRLVDRLCTAGYVRREPDPEDGRGTLAVLCPAGLEALRQAAPLHLAGVERLFTSVLTREERRAMADAFARIQERVAPERLAL